jgi:hypothetical protein
MIKVKRVMVESIAPSARGGIWNITSLTFPEIQISVNSGPT